MVDVFLDHCPKYFWNVPASNSYHQEDVRGAKGLWLHSCKAATVYEELKDSYVEMGLITEYELDCGRAAILLHDLFKRGLPGESGEALNGSAVCDHDVVAAEYLKSHTELPREVISCVDTHNGPWYEGGSPSNSLEGLHHSADMIASRGCIHVEIENLAEELKSVAKM